jgi:hypothetical protein
VTSWRDPVLWLAAVAFMILALTLYFAGRE